MRSRGKKVPLSSMRRKGRISWFNTLMRAGKLEEATAWCRLHRLHIPPQSDPTLCVTLPGSAPEGAVPASPAAAASSPVLAKGAAAAADCISSSTTGGAGVNQSLAVQNLDQSGLGVENPQLRDSVGGELGAVPLSAVGSAPGGACLASPSGEVEGKAGVCQANIRETDGWEVEGVGVVGNRCRNKWFVEVQVRNGWAKADVGDWLVQRGDRVKVRLKWVSGDGRDAEYELVEKMVPVEVVKVAAPVGFAAQGNVGVAHWEPVKVEAEVAVARPDDGPSATDLIERMRQEAYEVMMRG